MKAMHAQGGPWLPGVERVRQPYSFNEGFGQDPRAFGEAAADAVEQKILEVGPEKVAAFIGEPRSEEHTSELQSLMRISYAVFCLKKKKTTSQTQNSKTITNAQHT